MNPFRCPVEGGRFVRSVGGDEHRDLDEIEATTQSSRHHPLTDATGLCAG